MIDTAAGVVVGGVKFTLGSFLLVAAPIPMLAYAGWQSYKQWENEGKTFNAGFRAINEHFNPAVQLYMSGYSAYHNWQQGNYFEAGEAATLTLGIGASLFVPAAMEGASPSLTPATEYVRFNLEEPPMTKPESIPYIRGAKYEKGSQLLEDAFWTCVEYGKEAGATSHTTPSGETITTSAVGTERSVIIPGLVEPTGRASLSRAIHTHPQTGVASLGTGDVVRMGTRVDIPLTAEHHAVGLRWPHATRVLLLEGLEAPRDVNVMSVSQSSLRQWVEVPPQNRQFLQLNFDF